MMPPARFMNKLRADSRSERRKWHSWRQHLEDKDFELQQQMFLSGQSKQSKSKQALYHLTHAVSPGETQVFLFFSCVWDLNSGLHACKPRLYLLWCGLRYTSSPFFFCLFWVWGLANCLPGLAWTAILLISASQVARIIGVSHQHPAPLSFE
jgi:hypothetical protein